jgi:hypothetical protein
VIEGFYRDERRALGVTDPRTGIFTAVQRFGSDLTLNVHSHMLFLDGVYDAHGSSRTSAATSCGPSWPTASCPSRRWLRS